MKDFIKSLEGKGLSKHEDGSYLTQEQEGRIYFSDLKEDEISFLKTLLNCESLKDISKEKLSHLNMMSIRINNFDYYSKSLIIFADEPEKISGITDEYESVLIPYEFNKNLDLHINYIKIIFFNGRQCLKINFIQENFLDKIESKELKELASKNLRFIEQSDCFEIYKLDDKKPETLVEGDYILKEGYTYEILKYNDINELGQICYMEPEEEIYISGLTI